METLSTQGIFKFLIPESQIYCVLILNTNKFQSKPSFGFFSCLKVLVGSLSLRLLELPAKKGVLKPHRATCQDRCCPVAPGTREELLQRKSHWMALTRNTFI